MSFHTSFVVLFVEFVTSFHTSFVVLFVELVTSFYTTFVVLFAEPPKGGRGISDVSPLFGISGLPV